MAPKFEGIGVHRCWLSNLSHNYGIMPRKGLGVQKAIVRRIIGWVRLIRTLTKGLTSIYVNAWYISVHNVNDGIKEPTRPLSKM